MKFFQLILHNSPSADLRYAEELYNGICVYFPEYDINKYILDDENNLSEAIINLINTCDYLFIHNLGNNKNYYKQLCELITCKKILFITNQSLKKFLSKINLEYIELLLNSCYKIVLNQHINGLVKTIMTLAKQDITNKLIQLDYIYEPDYNIINNIKNKEIIQISNKGLDSKYELFINLFENKQNYFNDFIWKIYGVEKGQYKDYAELIRGESGKEGVITLGTSIIGRGTTIDTTEKIDGAGGIHVIIDGLHETSSRNQLQYMARTARGTNDGSTIEYFAYDDIPEDYRDGIAVDAPADEVYQKVYERVDHRTKSVRDNVDHFVTRVRELSKNIQDMPEVVMSQEKKTEAMSMLIARGFSIQNRALGVSDNFKENIAEYDREMEMFMKMYVAEVMHGPGFDEVDWMKKNNYGDKVSTYIPFSEREKKNLFSLEGVVRIAQEVRTGEVKTSAQFSKEAVETERASLNPELANDENKKEEGR